MVKIKFEKGVDTRKCYSTGSILGQNGKIKNEVFDNPIVHAIIKDIDGGDVVDRNIIRLPKYDLLIPTMSLAGGHKHYYIYYPAQSTLLDYLHLVLIATSISGIYPRLLTMTYYYLLMEEKFHL